MLLLLVRWAVLTAVVVVPLAALVAIWVTYRDIRRGYALLAEADQA